VLRERRPRGSGGRVPGPTAARFAVAKSVELAGVRTPGQNRGCGSAGFQVGRERVMSGDQGQFLDACGANGPLRLEWDDCENGQPVCRDFDRPAIVIGRNPRADLVLDHPLVGRRHAYLQLVEGRLFAVDLGSREGLRWSGVPRAAGGSTEVVRCKSAPRRSA
jgi:FHA domain